jgi:FtsZ-binding cell division protein ZapB
MENIKVGIDAFNDLAKSHDAHVKEVERLQEELEQTKNTLYSTLRGIQERVVQLLNRNDDLTRKLKLIDQNGKTR